MKFESMLENKDNSDNLIDSAKKGVRKIFLTGAIAAGISSSSTGVEASPIGTEGLDKSLEKNITSPEQKVLIWKQLRIHILLNQQSWKKTF